MATNIAEYYLDEVRVWNRLINFFGQEIEELTMKLGEIVQRNTIPNIAAKVELEQAKLNEVFVKFIKLQKQFQEQLKSFKTDGTPKPNADINEEAEKQQNKYREIMQDLEKEYAGIKYACHNFLSDTLMKHNGKEKDSGI